jgi:diadenylate cyclase
VLSLPAPLADLIDILLVAALAYAAIEWLRRARADLALVGIGILGIVYLLARQLGLGLTAWIFQGFFAVFLILIVVIFQADLRQGFERIALWGLRRNRVATPPADATAQLASATAKLAATRRGALLVLPGRDPVERHLQGGIPLEGRLSEPLLLSLFDPHSPGHDGAVLLDRDVIRRFAVHLPLSADRAQLGLLGTRHAAALGLAERTDALCIVVSEEQGTVSVARDGRLRTLGTPAELASVLADFRAERLEPAQPERTPLEHLRANWRVASAALATSLSLWLVMITGSEVAEQRLSLPVVIKNLPAGYALERVEPPAVDAVISGLRRDLFFVPDDALRVEVDALLVQLGRRTFDISPESVVHPSGVQVKSVEPGRLKLFIRVEPT